MINKLLEIQREILSAFFMEGEEKIYEEILNVILKCTESENGLIGYIDKKENWVICASKPKELSKLIKNKFQNIIKKKNWAGVWGKAMNEKKIILINKVGKLPKWHPKIFNALDMPIVFKDKLIANIIVGNKKGNYNEEDLKLLEEISSYLAPVVHCELVRLKEEEEKKELQKQLYQIQKMDAIGKLAGGIAHDFNNILSIIIGNCEILMKKIDKENTLHKNILEIYDAAKRSSDLTKKLLGFARKQTITLKTFKINEKIRESYDMFKRLIGENIEIKLFLDEDVGYIRFDPAQIDQILTNLCINSRDAIMDNGIITIETYNFEIDDKYCSKHYGFIPGKYFVLAISDNGCGIKEEHLNHIFEPFFTTKEKGTGLGLSTVYGIVKQNNGFINVYSAEGKGTTFKIYFPEFKGKAKINKEKKHIFNDLKAKGETVLIVEDEESILNFCKNMLEGLGYKVLASSKPYEAIQIAKEFKGKIDLLLTDVIMPDMNGKELEENLKKYHPKIKTLYMSGYSANIIKHNNVLDKETNFIQKPFSSIELAEKIKEILNK